jgi:hypothetical protein
MCTVQESNPQEGSSLPATYTARFTGHAKNGRNGQGGANFLIEWSWCVE